MNQLPPGSYTLYYQVGGSESPQALRIEILQPLWWRWWAKLILTGMDATSFIRSIRMKAACQLMAQTPNIRISELAERVGYHNPQYFATCFKKEFGVTPREYMQEK